MKFNINMQEHKPLRELVYAELRMAIMTGKIKPGTRMMEVELAEGMGVSRTPIREAIRQLEKDNLVTIEPRRGAYVSDISAEDMEKMLIVREPLEGLATYLAAVFITPERLSLIREAKEEYEGAYGSGDTEGMIQSDTRFHNAITQASGNEYLISILGGLQEQVLRFRYIYFKSASRAKDVIEEHNLIYDCIALKDADAARRYSVDHIVNLRNTISWEDDFKTQIDVQASKKRKAK